MWKKFQKFLPHKLQDMSFWIHKNPFEGPTKTKAAALYNLTFVWKNVHVEGASLDSFFKASWLHIWKNIRSFEIVQHIRKKIINRKK